MMQLREPETRSVTVEARWIVGVGTRDMPAVAPLAVLQKANVCTRESRACTPCKHADAAIDSFKHPRVHASV